MKLHNAEKTCWNCPCIDFKGNVDFRACGQSMKKFLSISGDTNMQAMVGCKRRPDIGMFDPFSVTFEECPEWQPTKYGYMLKNMKVMILGMDGYLGWTLALWLGSLGFEVSGVDNYSRRDWVMEKGSHTMVPIERMTERLHAAQEILGIELNFRKMDIQDRSKLPLSLLPLVFTAKKGFSLMTVRQTVVFGAEIVLVYLLNRLHSLMRIRPRYKRPHGSRQQGH